MLGDAVFFILVSDTHLFEIDLFQLRGMYAQPTSP